MADMCFANVEVLSATNTKVLAINHTRVSRGKGYGLMTPIATFDIAVSDILNALDVQPVKRGKWKHVAGMNSKCSVCSHYFPVSEFDSRPFDINFCPNCGARMDGDAE